MPQNLRFRRGNTSERGGILLYGEPYVNIEINALQVGGLDANNNDIIYTFYTGSGGGGGGTGAGFPYVGNAIITGSLFVSNSIAGGTVFTASLQEGYVWVGGGGNISTIISTSSFGGGVGGGHVIQSESVSFTQRTNLNFRRFQVIDDSANNATIITRPADTAISESAPNSIITPVDGDIWTDSTTFKTYVWYDSYWVEISNNPTGSSSGGVGVGFPFSGSAIITGSLFVSNSVTSGTTFTASLQEGYTWVGGANNISVLISTSSFGGGGGGTNGSSGTSGVNGSSGTAGSSGTRGSSGTAGSSGTSGANGSSGTAGSSGTRGSSGTAGSSGTSGANGSSGTSGSTGSSGTSGTSVSITGAADNRVLTSDGTANGVVAETNLIFDGVNNALGIGTTTVSNEGNIFLGPKNTQEGGQIFFQAGTSYTSASALDVYQNGAIPYFRILRGSNTTSDAIIAQWDLHSKQMFLPAYNSVSAFSGTATAYLAVNTNGDVITVSAAGVGSSGTSGSSGSSGTRGSSGTSGANGSSGTSGVNGSSGTSGVNGSSGTAGSTGSSGTAGSSGTSGANGSSGTAGSSGTSGANGSSGTAGSSGTSGANGSSGTAGSSGTSGANGSSGTSGSSGTRGSSGTAGSSGTSGTGFTTITTPLNNRVLTSDGTNNAAVAEPNLIFDSAISQLMVSNSLVVSGSQNGFGVPLFEVRELSATDGAYFIISSGSIDHLKITTGGQVIATASILFVSNSLNTAAGNRTTFSASLQQGYTWVGGVGDISYAAATSSFGSGGSGSSGTSGVAGSSGTSGSSGTRGSSGTAGSSGTSGTGFSTITTPANNRVLTSDGTVNAAVAESNLIFNAVTSQLMVSNSLVVSGSQNGVGIPLFEVRELSGNDTEYFIVSSGSIDHLKITTDGVILSTGSLSVSQSLTTGTNFTASLQQGYTWVGDSNNISTIVTTSSLGGAIINSNVNNYVLTATGTTNTLQGESKFTYDGNIARITGSLVVSGSNGGGVFSKGITLADVTNGISVSGSYMSWRAPFSCSVISVYGYREGGGATQINAARTSSAGYSLHSATNLSLTTPGIWSSVGTVQNTIYNPGDGLHLIVSGSGSTQIAVQVDFLKVFDPSVR